MLEKFRAQPFHRKLYIGGFVVSAIAMLLSTILQVDGLLWIVVGSLSPILFTTGFVIWVWPVLAWALENHYTKAAFALLNIALVAIATVLSRNAVSTALGLPSLDFDLTVSIILAISYPIALLVTLSLITVLVALILMLVYLIPSRYVANIRILKIRTNDTALGAVGSIATGVISSALLVSLISQSDLARSIILKVAYYADFQAGPLYPGVERDRRYRLHENGVVSYAIKNGGHIEIVIGKVKD